MATTYVSCSTCPQGDAINPLPLQAVQVNGEGPLSNLPATNVPLRNTASGMRSGRDVMGMLANRIWHVALARVEVSTIMFSRWHGWGRTQNWWGEDLWSVTLRQESINGRY